MKVFFHLIRVLLSIFLLLFFLVVNELSRNENIAPRSTARRQLTFYDSDDSIADLELSDSDEEPITELQHVDDTLNGSDVLEIHNSNFKSKLIYKFYLYFSKFE